MLIPQPQEGEYAAYYDKYIKATAKDLESSEASLLALLAHQPDQLESLPGMQNDANGTLSYAPGKWTLTESVIHVSDTERVFSYRLLRIARNDATPLPGFEHDDWVPQSRAHLRSLSSAIAEFRTVRNATVSLVETLDQQALANVGAASGFSVSARALVWIIAGHSAHHMRIIAERYLGTAVPR